MYDIDENDEVYLGLEDSCKFVLNPKNKPFDAMPNERGIKQLSKKAPFSSLSETTLKENEIALLSDLIDIEEKEKAAKECRDAEFENLKKEIERLQEVQTLNDAKISELLAVNVSLKKNICSLYKTAKSEIEHKDNLLTEANKKLDNFLLNKNVHDFQAEKFEKSSHSNYKESYSDRYEANYQPDYRQGFKRKGFEDPPTSFHSDVTFESSVRSSKLNKTHNNRQLSSKSSVTNIDKQKQHKILTGLDQSVSECKSDKKSSKQDRHTESTNEKDSSELSDKNIAKQKCTKESASTDSVPKLAPKEKCSKLVQTEEAMPYRKSSKLPTTKVASTQTPSNQDYSLALNSDSESRDKTETNNVFFSLLPVHLKQAFIEYEKKQIISLNRLKQSFVNQHFDCDTSVHSPDRACNHSELTASFNHILFNKDLDASSVNTTALLTPSTSSKNETDNHQLQCGDTPPSINSSSINTKPGSCELRTNMKNDLVSHSSRHSIVIQTERIRSTDKKKSRRDGKSKGIVPKRIL